MLARHGEASAARQFSGRMVADDWACPFRRSRAAPSWDAQQVAADLRTGGETGGRRWGCGWADVGEDWDLSDDEE